MRRLRKPVALLLITCMLLAVAPALPASAEWTPPSTLTAKSVYLVNYDTGTVLYSKDAEKQMFPASITKIMTAILVAEKFHDNLDTVVTVTSDDVNAVPYGSSLMGTGLKAGEQITVRQLLYGLLLPSGNDAAIVLARVTASDGKVATFVDEMNKKAKELGCKGTHYTNPHGFQDANHYSTAKDTFIISKFAMTDKTVGDVLSQIVSTTAYSFRTNKQYYSMVNVNSMLLSGVYYYKYAKGIKTGSTDDAGDCLTSYATNGSMTYYCVVLGSTQVDQRATGAFADSKTLYDWAFGNFSLKQIVENNSLQTQVNLELAWNKTKLKLYAGEQFNALVPNATDVTKVQIVPKNLAPTVMAPIKKGQKMCTADVILDGQKLGSIDLVSGDSVERSAPLYFVYMVGRFFGSKWFKLISAVLVALVVLVFVLGVRRKRRRRFSGRKRRRGSNSGSKVYKLPR
jgi:D-alanyl-D-alanine carboxypeptidase (penicillin-binding protein 5/6)